MVPATSESANGYVTLTGERIDLDALDSTRRRLALQIIALSNGNARDDYVKEARRLITEGRPYSTGARLFNEAIGAIYRDGFYRLTIPDDSEERKAFVNRLRHHPARPLLDKFLEGWATQGQFALDAKLELSVVDCLFRSVLEGTRFELDVETLHMVFERLLISPKLYQPHHYEHDLRFYENPFGQESVPPSVRELEVMKMATKAVHISSAEERRSFLEQEVARIYHLSDYHIIQDFVDHIGTLIEE